MDQTQQPDYTKWNLFKKMLYIENELETVKKELDVKLPNGSYKAVGEVDVIRAVKPLEFKYGVKSMPISRNVEESKETQTKSGTINQFMRLKTVYRFINVDDPKDFIDIDTYGDGVDSGDKAPGKAMTYADKYALLKAYKIATGDDPDKDPSEEQSKVTKQEEVKKTKEVKLASTEQVEEIKTLLDNNPKFIEYTLEQYKVSGLMKLTNEQANEVITKIKEKKNKK